VVITDFRKLFAFIEELRDFVHGLSLTADEFSKKTEALEAIMDEIDNLTDAPKTNEEEIKVLTKAIIIFASLSIDELIKDLNKAKEELEAEKKEWGEVYGDGGN
jgi:uncharacterized protein YgfB (UPF0149 family)